jgi:uracil-xanthine permease
MRNSFFPNWTEKNSGVIAPDERLPMLQTAVMGVQHVVAMFGATVLGPLLMGFDPNVAILMSGIGTLLFFVLTRGRVPSYLGSSFSFIASVGVASAYKVASFTPNPNLAVALGGIIVCGGLYFLIGLLIKMIGTAWIDKLMPPVVTGAIVAVIGLNLADEAVIAVKDSVSDAWFTLMTVLMVALIAVFSKGMLRRLLILVGLLLSSIIYAVLVNGFGVGAAGEHASKLVDLTQVSNAAWLGLPHFTAPIFEWNAAFLIAPVAIILVAENLGHLRAVSAMTGRDMNPHMGNAFMADGLATMVSASAGGTGVTTYAENIGVMAVTKIYSTLAFVFAALFAILLGFSPKMGALIQLIPAPVLAGVSVVVFGLIAVSGIKIWVDNQVDFSKNHNLILGAAVLIVGTNDFTLHLGAFTLGGIGVATFGAMGLHALLKMGAKNDV